jgi:hypothetical protein
MDAADPHAGMNVQTRSGIIRSTGSIFCMVYTFLYLVTCWQSKEIA